MRACRDSLFAPSFSVLAKAAARSVSHRSFRTTTLSNPSRHVNIVSLILKNVNEWRANFVDLQRTNQDSWTKKNPKSVGR